MKKRFLTAFFSAALVLTMTTIGSIGSIESKAEDTGVIAIDETNFPDEVFREYVTNNFDTDTNGSLSQAEADAVSEIDVTSLGVNDLTGIENFVNLKILNCGNYFPAFENNIITLNLSNNISLTTLICNDNELTTLDLSNNTSLKTLDCSGNQLSELNLSNNSFLSELSCGSNELTTLDLSNNTSLIGLGCDDNNLTTLNLKNNTSLTELHCTGNNLTSLDLSNNTSLTILYCDVNKLTKLNLKNNTSLIELHCGGNNLSSLDLTNNIYLTVLSCGYSPLTNLDISNNTSLISLDCASSKVTTLDLTNNTSLQSLSCYSCSLTSLDVSKNINLKSIYYWDNSITEINFSNQNTIDKIFHFAAPDNSTVFLGSDINSFTFAGSNLTICYNANIRNQIGFRAHTNNEDFTIDDITNVKGGTVTYGDFSVSPTMFSSDNIIVTITPGEEKCTFTAEGHNFIVYAPAENTIPYTITYNLDGGTNNSSNPTVYYAIADRVSITGWYAGSIILEAPTKEGYTFAGWYTDENFTTKITEIQKGSKKNYNLYAKWIKDTPENGWFEDEDGNKFYFKNKESIKADWFEDEDKWYYFGKDGVAVTDWQNIDGSWYYFDKECVMMTGWIELDGNWYYLDNSGAMLTDWQVISGTWYYFYGSGAMAESTWIEGCYVGTSGAWIINPVTEGWQIYNGKWWYQLPDSSYPVNEWKKISGVWYYFDNSGYMATGWVEIIEKDNDNKDYSTWYYMEKSGAMKTGWLNDNGTWYYLNDSGVMVTDTVIDGCTINENGVWVQ